MKLTRKIISKLKDERGVSAIVVAVVLVMLIGFLALAIDIGYLYATKNELQNTADAAALAGAGQLGQTYKSMTSGEIAGYDCSTASSPNDCATIKAQAKDVVGDPSKNLVAGKTDMMITDGDITLFNMLAVGGNTRYGDNPSDPDITFQPDAVRVFVRRESGANGPIVTFFARIFGIETAEVFADATAALTGPAKVDEGEMNLPIGLSWVNFFNNCDKNDPRPIGEICLDLITFSPTTDSCAGWHNFFEPINADAEAEKLISFIEGNECENNDCDTVLDGESENGDDWLAEKFDIADNKLPEGTETPVTTSGDSAYFFQGGTISSLFNGGWLMWNDADGKRVDPMLDGDGNQMVDGNEKKPAPFPALFDYFRFRDGDADAPGEDTDGDGEVGEDNNEVWTAVAPIYADNCPCDNPNTELEIIGFARTRVYMPNPPPDSTVTANVDCEWTVIEGRGGGGNIGNLKGSIPNLVE